jgi:hypothetical protein
MKTRSFVAIGTLALSAVAGISSADIINNESQMAPGSTLMTFEDMPVASLGADPIRIGNITFSSTSGLSIASIAGYAADGTVVNNKTLQPVSSPLVGPPSHYVPLTMTFDNAVAEVGFGWFDPNFEGNKIEAYDGNGNLLETGYVALGPIGGYGAAFIGVRREANDIKSVRIINPSIDDVYSIDNIRTNTIPTPGVAGMMAAGGLVALRRKRK